MKSFFEFLFSFKILRLCANFFEINEGGKMKMLWKFDIYEYGVDKIIVINFAKFHELSQQFWCDLCWLLSKMYF